MRERKQESFLTGRGHLVSGSELDEHLLAESVVVSEGGSLQRRGVQAVLRDTRLRDREGELPQFRGTESSVYCLSHFALPDIVS